MHVCVCVVTGHAAPPLAAGVVTVKVCVCEPPPQLALHPDQPDQVPTQSTGQPCTLHGCVCGETGHEAPPWAGCCFTVKVCDCVPPPQVAEQADQPDQVPWQSTAGQACGLHTC